MPASARSAACGVCALFAVAAAAADFPTPLPAESIPKVETLPAHYPTTWSFLNYAGDRIELRNVGADSRDVKGQLQAHDSATLLVSDKRPEIYVADTVWSRGVRGVRTDFITIYDTQTFNPVGEIVLPGAKRALITAMEGLIAFTDEQRSISRRLHRSPSSISSSDRCSGRSTFPAVPSCIRVDPAASPRCARVAPC
jgi:methylamine dehydrogenase heavy chain